MRNPKKVARAVRECKYHLIWCPTYRFRILGGDVGNGARETIRQLRLRCDMGVLTGILKRPLPLEKAVAPVHSLWFHTGYRW